MSENTNKHVINIDIEKIFNDNNILAEKLIHQQTRNKLDKLLKDIVGKSGKAHVLEHDYKHSVLDQLNAIRSTNTIFIHGKRGAGKTTFIKSILLEYLYDKDQNIYPIAFIDPTLVGTGQHLLVDIIVRIDMEVKKRLTSCNDELTNNNYRNRIARMAEGLKLLENYNSTKPESTQWFQEKAFKDSLHGQSLERYLDEYIDCVIGILKTDLLLIAIDDVDTETSAAYQVLEILRRYITHPRVCVIMTGDEKLYNLIVHGKKLESLGNDQSSRIRSDGKVQDKEEMATHLTQQYLLKILPAYQRLKLQDVATLLQGQSQTEINIIEKDKHTIDIVSYWKDIFCRSLYLTENESNKLVNIVLKQPIRSILQFIYKINQDSKGTNLRPYHLVDTISQVFFTELFSESTDIDALNRYKVSPNDLGKNMLKLYTKYGELETGFYARPDTNSDSFNVTQLLLSAAIANYTQFDINLNSKEKISSVLANTISVMITTGAACNIFMNYVENSTNLNPKQVTDTSKNKLVDDYSNYIGLNGKDNLYNIATHYSPILLNSIPRGKLMLASGVARTKRQGVVKLKDFLKKAGNEANNNLIDASGTIVRLNKIILEDSLFENNIPSLYAGITCCISAHAVNTSETTNDYVSCYALLSFLVEFLEIHNTIKVNKSVNLRKLLLKRIEIPTYSAPPFFGKNADSETDTDNELSSLSSNNNNTNTKDDKDYIDGVVAMLIQWAEMQPFDFGVSSILQGKIWARVFYSLNRVAYEFQQKGFFGIRKRTITGFDNVNNVLLHEFIGLSLAAVINAFLIEESRYYHHDNTNSEIAKVYSVLAIKLQTAQNVASTLDKLEDSLSKVRKVLDESQEVNISDIFPLTYGLLTCPLIIPYLIQDFDEFDASAEKKWSTNTTISGVIREILQKEGSAIKNIFWNAENEKLPIDMRYISALPIVKSN